MPAFGGVRAAWGLLSRPRLGLPEVGKSRERLAQSCQNGGQNQRAQSHRLPHVEALFSRLTVPGAFAFSPPTSAYCSGSTTMGARKVFHVTDRGWLTIAQRCKTPS